MLLPNGDKAVIPPEKLRDYLLNEDHPEQPGHAVLFRTLLGITPANAVSLSDELLKAAREGEAILGLRSPHGQKYEIRFSMTGLRGTYTISSVWIIATGTDYPRLVTAFIE